MYKRILVPLDGSKLAEGILPTVGQFASGLNARVELLAVVDRNLVVPGGGRATTKVATDAKTRAEDYLRAVIDQSKLPKERTSLTATVATVSEDIVKEAGREPDTLIAISTHGRSGLGRFRLGSVVDKVLHEAKEPLLLYRARQWAVSAPLSAVVVPLDGSALAERALPHVRALAKALHLRVLLTRVQSNVHTYETGEGIDWYPADFQEQIDADADTYLANQEKRLRADGLTDVSTRLLEGSAASAIVDLVQEIPNCFVAICTRGRTGAAHAVFGSVADRIVDYANAPVLVIKP